MQYKDTTEAAIEGVKSILGSCIRSKTVERLIYTGSVVATSPLKEDGSSFKDLIDESCWTPLHHSFSYSSFLDQVCLPLTMYSTQSIVSIIEVKVL